MKTCAMDGCSKVHQARKMCMSHYIKYYRSTTRGKNLTSDADAKYRRSTKGRAAKRKYDIKRQIQKRARLGGIVA